MAFESFSSRLLGLAVSHVSQGADSVLKIEFGDLRQPAVRAGGSIPDPEGEMGLAIDGDWRIEDQVSILAANADGAAVFARLQGAAVDQVQASGQSPNIVLRLSNGVSVVAGSKADEAAWTLWDRRAPRPMRLRVQRGRAVIEQAPTTASVFLKPSP